MEVIRTSYDTMGSSFLNLKRLGVEAKVRKVSMALNNFRSVLEVFKKFPPVEIYKLADQTSVMLSLKQSVETRECIAFGTLNILEAIRFVDYPIHFYNAKSSECFGDTRKRPANVNSPFSPRSPYAVAKSAAYGLIVNYSESYGLFACTGILFNHESQLRPVRFVTQTIIKTAFFVSKNFDMKLSLGNISTYRDWGWAPEYVEAM